MLLARPRRVPARSRVTRNVATTPSASRPSSVQPGVRTGPGDTASARMPQVADSSGTRSTTMRMAAAVKEVGQLGRVVLRVGSVHVARWPPSLLPRAQGHRLWGRSRSPRSPPGLRRRRRGRWTGPDHRGWRLRGRRQGSQRFSGPLNRPGNRGTAAVSTFRWWAGGTLGQSGQCLGGCGCDRLAPGGRRPARSAASRAIPAQTPLTRRP